MISSIFLEIIPYGTDLEFNEISTPIEILFYIIQNKNICFAIEILYKAEAHCFILLDDFVKSLLICIS